MITILHGDNVIASRKILIEKIDQAKKQNIKDIISLDGKSVTSTEVIQALESKSLFGSDRLVIIENMLSRPRSKDKESIISIIKENEKSHLILWENKTLTKNQLNQFSKSQNIEFKTPTIIFKFLDALYPNNQQSYISLYQKAVDSDSPENVFYMLSRQVRLMLQTLDKSNKLPPWQQKKLKSQLDAFGLHKATILHKNLLDIDERIKTGQSPFGLQGELDLLLAKL